MTGQEAVSLFHQMHPGFFDRPHIRAMNENTVAEELVLDLHKPFPSAPLPQGEVSFGFWDGTDLPALKAAVAQVDEGWAQYFGPDSRVYCGFCGGRIVSFCLVDDMGTHRLKERTVRVGGPGCVGTLAPYRRRGIGLKMVENATRLLRSEGFDLAYIHYTAVGRWYEKLGYRVIVQWTKHGIR